MGNARSHHKKNVDRLTYCSWKSMHRRCKDPKKTYLIRNITICPEWINYENFLRDMGLRPFPNHSLERIDNNKGYYKANCRWATKSEQQQNTNRNILILYDGIIYQSLAALAKKLYISPRTIKSHCKKGKLLYKRRTELKFHY